MANSYFTCTLDAWNEGKVLYGRMHYYRSGSYTYQDSSFPNPTMNLGGTTYTDTAFGDRVRAGISVGNVYTTTFSRTVSGSGNRTVTFTAGSGQRSDFAGTWSKTVYIPETYTAPTGLNITIAEIYPTGAKFNVSVSSYGNPSSTSGRYIEAGILNQNSYGTTYKYQNVKNTASSAITVTNSSYKGGTLTISPNTMYYYGCYANNTQKDAKTVKGQFVTTAAAPIVSFASVTSTTATFNYATQADGGYYNKTIEYSIDGGTTWATAATVSGGGAASGSFTISNLLSGAAYTLATRTTTASGSTLGTNIEFNTVVNVQNYRITYGSVLGGAKPVTELYGSVNGDAKKITKLYGGVEGEAKLIYQGFGHLSYD